MKPARPKRTRLRAGAKSGDLLSVDDLGRIQEIIGYTFRASDLLIKAFTHASALATSDRVKLSNQRLEFLGDRVLGLTIAERLYRRRPTEREGALAPRLNRLVNKGACAEAFRALGLGEFIILGASEKETGGADKEGILGDACEALIGAIYLDGGLSPARHFIERAWSGQLTAPAGPIKDEKSQLQEWAQAQGLGLPVYRELARQGPDHAPVFTITVQVEGYRQIEASGPSKRDAERAAARALLLDLEDKL